MDKLRAMQTFALVAELGSFTKAANALQLPNASVSTLIAQLESQLQTKLLARTTRRVSLTDDGAAYLEGVRRVIADLSELDSNVMRAGVAARGRLRIDVPAAAGRHFLAPALPDFLARYPDIAVEIGSTDRPVDLVMEGVDCVIRGGAVHDELLVARKLGAFEYITCAAPQYLKSRGMPKTMAHLQTQDHTAVNFFSAKTGRVFAFDFDDGKGDVQSIQLPHQVAANDADTHVALTCAGLGLAQLPNTDHVLRLMREKQLVRVLPQWSSGELPLYIMYPRNRHLSARLRAFVDWTVDLYSRKFASRTTSDVDAT
ncbi:MAG: LysR family transcriptional regulator [Betaproteobacteria bacterium]|nr:MAG: LysR family transcriptional regulator [Betaproteobacteria bacterium]